MLACLVGGCFPSFDGLTGRNPVDASPEVEAAVGASPEVEAAIDAPVPASDGSGPANCIDSSAYPGNGVYKADFSDVSDMILNGTAVATEGALRLAGVEAGGVGSAYISAPFAFDSHTSFFAHFAMRIGGGAGQSGSDGMAFVVQSSLAGPKAVGNGGGGLAYDGVKPSIAVEFDTFFNPATDPDGNHVALLADGNSSVHIAHATPPFRLNDGVLRNVWIDYDWSIDLLEVYMSDDTARPSAPLLKHAGGSYMASLGSLVYIGASAATGTSRNDHELHGEAWIVTSPLAKCR